MRIIERIMDEQNIKEAIKEVKANKGAPGIDKMTVFELDEYFNKNLKVLQNKVINMKYYPTPVKRVYIPKSNGKQRPLGIPTVTDRVLQQATAKILSKGYEKYFSDFSYGFRPGRCQHQALRKTLEYVNDGYIWIIDLDIEKFFDTVNQDKLISILRERVKEKEVLHLVRKFLQAGIMEKGLVSTNTKGMPQGGPLSPLLSNIYLDKLDKELEARGLRFVRFADDTNIFVKSEKAANRVMKSITWWIERKLFLKVNATKTKVVTPTKSNFLGMTYWKAKDEWKLKPMNERKQRLYDKIKFTLIRKKASAESLKVVFTKINQIVIGWINYFKIGSMKIFMQEFSSWLRHKVRVIILKQWKKPRTIYKNLQKLNRIIKANMTHEEIFKVANSRLGPYKKANGYVVNFLLSPKILEIKTKDRPGLVNPLYYYTK